MSRRVTVEACIVAAVLVDDPAREWYIAELADEVNSGTSGVTQLLQRLHAEGWVLDRWEDNTPAATRRQLRHYYRINPDRIPDVCRALADVGQRVARLALWAPSFANDDAFVDPSPTRSPDCGRRDSGRPHATSRAGHVDPGVDAMILGHGYLARRDWSTARQWFEIAATYQVPDASTMLKTVDQILGFNAARPTARAAS